MSSLSLFFIILMPKNILTKSDLIECFVMKLIQHTRCHSFVYITKGMFLFPSI